GDRNTDQDTNCNPDLGGFGYHPISAFANLPDGFVITPNGWNSKVCSVYNADPLLNGYVLELKFPKELNCEIQVEMYTSNGTLIYVFTDIINVEASLHPDGVSKVLRWRLPH